MKKVAAGVFVALALWVPAICGAQEPPPPLPQPAEAASGEVTAAEPAKVEGEDAAVGSPESCSGMRVQLYSGTWFEVGLGDDLDIEFGPGVLPDHCLGEIKASAVGFDERDATLHQQSGGRAYLHFHPRRSRSLGEHNITLSVTYRDVTRTERITVKVVEEWETFFMPGLQYSVLVPSARQDLGIFQGVSVEYLIAAWIHRNENRGPSHGRVYANIDLLQSTESDVSEMLLYHLGLDLSLERNPRRSWLIPFFGLEAGGAYQKEIGSFAQIVPMGGLRIYGSQNVFINVIGGYFYPTRELEDLRGWRGKVGMNVSLW